MNHHTAQLVHEMRVIKTCMWATTDPADYVQYSAQLAQKFHELDEVLSNGAVFPDQWITKENQVQQTFDANGTQFSTDREVLYCGHVESTDGRCAVKTCKNYANKPVAVI